MRLSIISILLLTSISTYGQLEKISKLLEQIDSTKHLNGVVLVAQGNEVIFQKAYGMANHSLDIPNTIDTKFLVGSLTKQFTAMLVMQLVEANQLSLDVPITAYLSDFRKETGDQITMRHLLTHTHGIPNEELTNRGKPMEKAAFVKKYCEADLAFQPGTQFQYSDIFGYYLLGMILKEVTNRNFDDLLEEKILKPLDMQNTGYYAQDTILQNLATGYIREGDSLLSAPQWHMSQSFSAAGLYTTVGDLFKWDQALRSTQLLSREGMEAIFTPYRDKIKYGFGWYLNDPVINGEKRLYAGHNGGASGYRAQMMRGVSEELVVVYLSNTDQYVEIRYPIIEAILSE